jgi:hypothetical protein
MKRSGFKTRGKPLQTRKPMAKRSQKRQAYMASTARQDGLAHMMAVRELGCLICGAPAEAHHLPHPRDDLRTIPLCPFHHRREYGPEAYHYSRRNFNALHGSDEELLERVRLMLASLD